jgi:hypothetical protein
MIFKKKENKTKNLSIFQPNIILQVSRQLAANLQ